jgi:glyoxylase-like metal-dependent hydrolase (beta-lactamase superfamily II)
VGNAGIVDLGGGTLVFDTFVTPGAARDLRAAAERVAPVTGAVNSHWHGDHVRGNVVFADVPIAATTRTRELIADDLPRVEELKRDPDVLARWPDYAELEQVLPERLLDERSDLGGAELLPLGAGHTRSDSVLLAGEVLFTADLVVAETHPWMGHGDPENWLTILDEIERLAPSVIVPGHGPVCDLGAVAGLRGYIESLLADPSRPAEPGWGGAGTHERNAEFVRSRGA